MPSDDDEVLEVLDAAGVPTGTLKRRDDVHADGDWHRAVHLWVMHTDGYVLVQRRARTKDLAGGKVDVSVAGHVRPGASVLDLVREAEEEIGLLLRPGELDFLETIRSERHYPDGRVDRELQDVYAVVVDRALPEYQPRPGEVDVLYEIPLARAIELYRDGVPTPVAGWDSMARNNDALLVTDDLIEQGREATLASLERLAVWWESGGRS